MLVQGLVTQVQQQPGGPTDRLREREAPPGPVAARSAGAHQRLHRHGRLARFRLRGRARRFGARPAAQQEHLDPVPASPAEPLRGARELANPRRAVNRRAVNRRAVNRREGACQLSPRQAAEETVPRSDPSPTSHRYHEQEGRLSLLVGSALWVISPAERAAGEGRAAEEPSNPPRRVAVSCISVLPQPEHEGSA